MRLPIKIYLKPDLIQNYFQFNSKEIRNYMDIELFHFMNLKVFHYFMFL